MHSRVEKICLPEFDHKAEELSAAVALRRSGNPEARAAVNAALAAARITGLTEQQYMHVTVRLHSQPTKAGLINSHKWVASYNEQLLNGMMQGHIQAPHTDAVSICGQIAMAAAANTEPGQFAPRPNPLSGLALAYGTERVVDIMQQDGRDSQIQPAIKELLSRHRQTGHDLQAPLTRLSAVAFSGALSPHAAFNAGRLLQENARLHSRGAQSLHVGIPSAENMPRGDAKGMAHQLKQTFGL